jgi:predicted O-linked N-acetylglucosamine transferase (SPINDLY family)
MIEARRPAIIPLFFGCRPMPTISEALAIAQTCHRAGRPDLAEEICRRILAAEPKHADAWHLLGCVARQAGRSTDAAEYMGRAVAFAPGNPEFHNNLGVVLKEQGRLDEAAASYQHALRLDPNYLPAHSNLANVWRRQGKLAEAIECLRRAIELDPSAPEPLNNLGNVLHAQGMLDEAEACYRRALELDSDFVQAYVNLGGVCKDQGNLAEADRCWHRALQLQPGDAAVHSNLVFLRHLQPEYDARAIAEVQREWVQRHAAPLAAEIRPHTNSREPERRLRIGYVSPDFRAHVVGFNLLPLFRHHDPRQFEVVCYDDGQATDPIAVELQRSADAWRCTSSLTDAQLAELVRDDRIDILVDLALHTAGNRLLTFARKPAPVQVTYLAYAGSSGLPTIDYRLTDPYLDPPDAERYYAERSMRLPETYWCYRPLHDTPPVGPVPAVAAGRITFGCLNNFCKLSQPTWDAWCRVLQAVPRSTLLLHARPGTHRGRVQQMIRARGIDADRVAMVDFQPRDDYYRLYQRIDVALDPFPYGGGMTTCDALWMGVPVVSLAGATAVGRGGLSILSNLGLERLVAYDVEQYVRLAAELGGDLEQLGELRAALRTRMQRSPLTNAPRFARNIEAAFRTMWRRWCGE